MKRVIGITGGIASGKSTILRMFGDLGAEVLSADDAARDVLLPGSPAVDEVVEKFGRSMVKPDGSIDREALANTIFRDPVARRALDDITHPRITKILEERIRLFRQESETHELLAVEIPLLVECNLAWLVDEVVVAAAEQDVQISRLKTRGLTPDQARQRVAAQAPIGEKLAVADWVVRTDVSLEDTRRQIELICKRRAC